MLRAGRVKRHLALWLENDRVSVCVLPHKGADIYEFTYRPRGVQFLLKTPAGLAPPAEGGQREFLENYEGGWQELFPNTGAACEYRGTVQPFHGEVALLPWTYQVERNDGFDTVVRFTVRCRRAPFRLERVVWVRSGEPGMVVACRVTNESDEPAHFVWGHHLALGGDFLEPGCYLDVPAKVLETPAEPFEPEATRLAPGQRETWPLARGRAEGERVDLRQVPGPEARSHDDAFLGELERGWVAVTNPRLQIRFSLEWDPKVFRWLVLWQPYGGSRRPPLSGAYGLGIEPWATPHNLAQALERGEALALGPRQSLATALAVRVSEIGPG